ARSSGAFPRYSRNGGGHNEALVLPTAEGVDMERARKGLEEVPSHLLRCPPGGAIEKTRATHNGRLWVIAGHRAADEVPRSAPASRSSRVRDAMRRCAGPNPSPSGAGAMPPTRLCRRLTAARRGAIDAAARSGPPARVAAKG